MNTLALLAAMATSAYPGRQDLAPAASQRVPALYHHVGRRAPDGAPVTAPFPPAVAEYAAERLTDDSFDAARAELANFARRFPECELPDLLRRYFRLDDGPKSVAT